MKLLLILLILSSGTSPESGSIRNGDQDIDEATLFNDWLLDDCDSPDTDWFDAFMFSDSEDEDFLFNDWLLDDVDENELSYKKKNLEKAIIDLWFSYYFDTDKIATSRLLRASC